MKDDTRQLIHRTLAKARQTLLVERTEQGHWEGELSTSALSTATAIVALGSVDEQRYQGPIDAATAWLVRHQNADGGWGDTVKSFSNISTSLLCWSALRRFGRADSEEAVKRATYWIRDYVGSLSPETIAETVKARYGKDRTFSVPILMLCAICGTLGPREWDRVISLPYYLAAFPRGWFATMRLPVVSYALPALIAIGYAKSRQSWAKWKLSVANPLWPRLSTMLSSIQPGSGGFLEAAPLTSFVTMALVAAGEKDHPVAAAGVKFLLETVRPDGSWPIDTNLATWATTLSVKALSMIEAGNEASPGLPRWDRREEVKRWLLDQQYRAVHPFTDAAPGGWAWTDLSGGVPDADDTPGALLALRSFKADAEVLEAARAGVVWLLDLQNRDGGIPTFCRGWGALPFDRSSPDLTAHTLRAWQAWRSQLEAPLQVRIEEGTKKALAFLERQQHSDGSWRPLWFGNQHRSVDEENPTYGTAKVLLALTDLGRINSAARRGIAWLLENQNDDGGWGAGRELTPSSIEETSLALSALAAFSKEGEREARAIERGVAWLAEATDSGTRFKASPIGFYFARLWYFERIYPIVWTVEALSRLTLSEESGEEECARNPHRSILEG